MTTAPLPEGFGIAVDADTKELGNGWLFGGTPARALRLSTSGRRAWDELASGPIRSRDAGSLARRLTDAGLAHPVPPPLATRPDITVVIPVYGRAAALERCLDKVDRPVIVVDDGSDNPDEIRAICELHGARYLRRDVNGGPGPARDTALQFVDTEFVAFLDSDCIPSGGWLDALVTQLADPLVGAAAPRVTPLTKDTWAGRYTRANSSLDLGRRPAPVRPGSRVAYVPTAALLVRLTALNGNGPVFDPELRVGEDVDLVWRLHEAGWRIRYVPDVTVHHTEPETGKALLHRRFRYGTSAGPLSARHPDAMAPLVLLPFPALTVAAAAARRPLLSAAAYTASVLAVRRRLRSKGIPQHGVTKAMANAAAQTWLGIGRYATQFAAPALAYALTRPRSRIPALALLLAPPLTSWFKKQPGLDPVRYTLMHIADNIAYGTGVWTGCRRQHTFRPVIPKIGVAWPTSGSKASPKHSAARNDDSRNPSTAR